VESTRFAGAFVTGADNLSRKRRAKRREIFDRRRAADPSRRYVHREGISSRVGTRLPFSFLVTASTASHRSARSSSSVFAFRAFCEWCWGCGGGGFFLGGGVVFGVFGVLFRHFSSKLSEASSVLLDEHSLSFRVRDGGFELRGVAVERNREELDVDAVRALVFFFADRTIAFSSAPLVRVPQDESTSRARRTPALARRTRPARITTWHAHRASRGAARRDRTDEACAGSTAICARRPLFTRQLSAGFDRSMTRVRYRAQPSVRETLRTRGSSTIRR